MVRMPSAKLTSKGQITLPKAIRALLALRAGDRVQFHQRADGSVVLEPETVDLRSLKGIVKPKVRGVTVEAMGKAVRQRAAKR